MRSEEEIKKRAITHGNMLISALARQDATLVVDECVSKINELMWVLNSKGDK